MPMNISEVAKTSATQEFEYNSFAGCDIVVYMGSRRVATLQGINTSISRELMPIYVFGDPNPKRFNKGKRAIAGTLTFTQFDRDAILKMAQLQNQGNTTPAFIGNLYNYSVPDIAVNALNNGVVANNSGRLASNDADLQASLANEMLNTIALVASRKIRYADQVPPFDVTVTLSNEEGASAYTAIHGCQLVNQGYGFTVDDLTNEVAYTYVARSVTPLTNLTGNLTNSLSALTVSSIYN